MHLLTVIAKVLVMASFPDKTEGRHSR